MPKGRVAEYAGQWGPHSVQRILDTALAWAVINRHFDVADFLLEHGSDINTNWNSHEPASILHHLVFLPNSYAPMQFLIDRGIDMTVEREPVHVKSVLPNEISRPRPSSLLCHGWRRWSR